MGMAMTLPLQRTLSLLFSTSIDLKDTGECFTPAPSKEQGNTSRQLLLKNLLEIQVSSCFFSPASKEQLGPILLLRASFDGKGQSAQSY